MDSTSSPAGEARPVSRPVGRLERALRIFALQLVGFEGVFCLLLVAGAFLLTSIKGVPFGTMFVGTTIVFHRMFMQAIIPIALISMVVAIVRYKRDRNLKLSDMHLSDLAAAYWRSALVPTNIMRLLRIIAVLYLSTMWVSNVKPLIRLYNPRLYDPLFRQIDTFICFGNDPFVWFSQFRAEWFIELMNFSYRIMFTMVFISLSILFVQKRYQPLRAFVAAIVILKLIGNITHFAVPTVGDCYTPDHLGLYSDISMDYRVRRLQPMLYKHVRILTEKPEEYTPKPFHGIAAFPSLHIAQMGLLCLLAWRYHRKLLWVYVPVGILMCISTIFWGWHYITDLIAGFLIAYIAYRLGRRLISWNLKVVRRSVPNRLNEVALSSAHN